MAAIKIVFMIGSPPFLQYIVNTIADQYEIALIVKEHTPTDRLWAKIKKKGLINSIRLAYGKLSNQARFLKDYNRILDNNWKSLPPNVPLLKTDDINDISVSQKLKEIKPDIILVHGTGLIKESTLQNAGLVLNLHGGLSPYYRGSYCTEWALLNHDPLNIGFTIHKLDSSIDGGDILTQGRIQIGLDDTANSINMKITKEGSIEIAKVLARLLKGEEIKYVSQEKKEGFLYLTRHWGHNYVELITKLEKRKAIKTMLEKPSRKALPIVKL